MAIDHLKDDAIDGFGALVGEASDIIQAGTGARRPLDATPRQVTWSPGSSLTIRYDVSMRGAPSRQPDAFVLSTGEIGGATVVDNGTSRVSMWKLPHDPLVPGLAPALDRAKLREILAPLGVDKAGGSKLLAYRPTRRAVVRVTTDAGPVYVKLVRPHKARRLHEAHLRLAKVLPVPSSLGFSDKYGMLVMPAMPGMTMRNALASGRGPSATQLLHVLDRIEVQPQRVTAGWRSAEFARLLMHLCPQRASLLGELVERLQGAEAVAAELPEVPVHGDFHDAQILLQGREISGVLDVDTVGMGRRCDDLANMIGHLTVLASLGKGRPVQRYAADLLDVFDTVVDPEILRMRIAAVILGLATGPFRVLEPGWQTGVTRRIDMAHAWVTSAQRMGDEKCLTVG